MSNSHETTQSDPPTNVTRALEVLQGVYGASSDESAQEDFQTNVTLALQVLQGASKRSEQSEIGLLFVPSTARLLMEEFGGGLTEGYVHEMNSVLALLGLRTSPPGNNAAGKRPHRIRLDVTEVTAGMVKEAYSLREARRAARLVEATPQETPLASPPVELIAANEPTSSDEEMDRAAAVIEALGKALAEANATIEGLTQANAQMQVVSKGLEQQVNELKAAKTAGSQKLRAALDAYGSLLPS